MKPYDVNIVTDYIIMRLTSDEDDKRMDLINLKLQKLLYYVQAWSYGIEGKRFLDTTFEAWVHGPVSREIFNRFKDTKNLYSSIGFADVLDKDAAEKIDEGDRSFVDYVLDNYAGFSGTELEVMTHKEQPWIEARKGYEPLQHCTEEITEASMIKYYGDRWKQIES